MFSHQASNSIGEDIYNGFFYRDVSWQNHLHRCSEVAFVLSGEISVTLSGREYAVSAGQSVFVSPYQLHSYRTLTPSLVFIAVFADEYVGEFSAQMRGKEFVPGICTLSNEVMNYAASVLFTAAPREDKSATSAPKPDRLKLKGCLYAVVAEFFLNCERAEYSRNDRLIYEIINYVENNFTDDVSLVTLADALGYDHRYLSRIFNASMGINFKTFVNQYRCDRAKRLMREGNVNLCDVALASGFQSVRTFNRVYRELTGQPPRAAMHRGAK